MAVRRKMVELDDEKFVITNLILNSHLCKAVLDVTDPLFFKSKGVHIILKWVKSHYIEFNEALGSKINDYYALDAVLLDEPIKDQIANILEHLSNVQSADYEVHNIDYLVSRAITLYKKKFFENQIKIAHSFIEKGEIDRAEEALAKRFEYISLANTAKNLDDPEYIQDAISLIYKGEEEDPFFMWEDQLGQFIGRIEPGWFISFIAPPKVGKTTFLIETLIAALLMRKNVVFFSFEMPIKQILARILKRITGLCTPGGGDYYVPVFDCRANQRGFCTKPERLGIGDIVDPEGGNVRPFSKDIEWTPCAECRGTKDFDIASWKVKVEKPEIDEVSFRKMVNAFMVLYGRHCKPIFYPSKTATVVEVNRDIDALIATENFIPDLIIIDYADLFKPINGAGGGQKRLELDSIWEELRALGQSRLVGLITASQTSKNAVNSKFIRQQDIAEDFSKIAKLDRGIGIAQTEDMKELGLVNINIVADRHEEFMISHTCTVLQDLKSGQGHLDSEYFHG